MHEPLEIIACRFVTGGIQSDGLTEIATEALVRGIDSPSLRELAGLPKTDIRDAPELFLAALDEIGVPIPTTKDEALWRLVRKTANDVVSGQVPPYQGALWIWTNAAYEVEEEGDLRIFIGLASERQDHPEASAEIDAQIVHAAEELLARPAPRRWVRLQAREAESPLSRGRPDGLEPLSALDLRISTDLTHALAQWATAYDATFGPETQGSGFETEDEAEAFVERGRSLADQLQSELGDTWRVDFMPEPIRPPGLRLRAR